MNVLVQSMDIRTLWHENHTQKHTNIGHDDHPIGIKPDSFHHHNSHSQSQTLSISIFLFFTLLYPISPVTFQRVCTQKSRCKHSTNNPLLRPLTLLQRLVDFPCSNASTAIVSWSSLLWDGHQYVQCHGLSSWRISNEHGISGYHVAARWSLECINCGWQHWIDERIVLTIIDWRFRMTACIHGRNDLLFQEASDGWHDLLVLAPAWWGSLMLFIKRLETRDGDCRLWKSFRMTSILKHFTRKTVNTCNEVGKDVHLKIKMSQSYQLIFFEES